MKTSLSFVFTFSSGGGGHTYNSSPSSSTANSHSGDDVSLATLESLTDLLPMMPASEAIKLSLKVQYRKLENNQAMLWFS